MPEESHLDEMREAIRGDFERLAERRGEQDLLHVHESEDGLQPLAPEVRQGSEREPGAEFDPEAEPEKRSWFARLLSP